MSLAALSSRVSRLSSRQSISRWHEQAQPIVEAQLGRSAAGGLIVQRGQHAIQAQLLELVHRVGWDHFGLLRVGGSVVVVGAAHVVVQRQRGLGRFGLQRLAIHATLEDRVDGAEPWRADRLRSRACGPQPLGPVAARQALQAQARAVALLGMRAVLHLRNTCRTPGAGVEAPTFEIVTTANAKHKRALELIQAIEP